mmetsp:Transcript_99948/g.214045  ORF Transcript_99948/g.214045 Transcript_99948/m.214045 type:complete len:450 (+) Transcript_99948:73-1422(+)
MQLDVGPWGKRILLLCCATALFCDYALFGVISPILPLMFLGKGTISDAALDRLFMSKAVVQLVCGPLAGYTVDRVGPRISMAVGLAVLALSSFMFGRSVLAAHSDHEKYWALLTWRSLQGVASAIIGPAGFALLAMMQDRTKNGGQQEFALVGAGMILGMIAGPCLAGLVAISMGMPFIVIGFITVAVLILHLVLSTMMPSGKNIDGANSHTEAVDGARQLARDPYLYCITAPLLTCVSVEALITVAQPLRLASTLHFDVGGIVLMFALFGFLAVGSGFCYGPLLGKRLSCQSHIVVGNVFMCIGLIGVFACSGLGCIAVGNGLTGISMSPIRIGSFMLIATLVDYRQLKVFGFAMSCQDMVACLGYIVGPFIASTVNNRYGLVPVVGAVALLITGSLPFYASPVETYRMGLLSGEGKSLAKAMDSEAGEHYASVNEQSNVAPIRAVRK